MKNQDVAIAFINGREAKGSNFKTDGIKLWSYSSLMAEWINNQIVVYNNIATYSMTSKKQWYYLRTSAPASTITIR